jgi:hypothetical protein
MQFFLYFFEFPLSFGAISFGQMPSNQGEEHSFAFYPFSTVTIVDATETL